VLPEWVRSGSAGAEIRKETRVTLHRGNHPAQWPWLSSGHPLVDFRLPTSGACQPHNRLLTAFNPCSSGLVSPVSSFSAVGDQS
jgi:hypothetical protein